MRIEYFQLIDRIVEVWPSEGRLRAEAQVPTESTIFEGHFPGHPLMPGVLLVESMAQTSGYAVLTANRFDRMPFLAGVREAKFRAFVEPGDVLDIEAMLEHDGSGFAMTSVKVKRAGKPICESRLTFRVMPFPTPDFRQMMLENATRLGYPRELLG
ncbi:3-hydroxyacyl-[acyl-carrier-protein] dehydratase [Tepidamorphus gemmatus]|uniref:3-hydroxyacyl-[acyl-carrier-protein] dehydratase n=1 Tax=Tepidamorphus gemmatus TaxID=747076 RepID=A0A4R3MKN3_9HYPH|nr:3-hydroxyacyl-ACP dehydratase FabZ family protein [Tepidamorphus gemmatus]TCT13288.1 3-hydroxyacyl-[acyl-carrier-protein] dehydratase [Tepidamorphus gemmatus]